uniref:Uncharacterized protein n=1 Tax=Phlebotomus papatasi TaxID=29031 RepID=A0A1B0EZL1_PHLPP
MVQRASTEAPSISGGHRESRMGLGIGYAAYQSGYNKLFTQEVSDFERHCTAMNWRIIIDTAIV